jgi:hypothetical protein
MQRRATTILTITSFAVAVAVVACSGRPTKPLPKCTEAPRGEVSPVDTSLFLGEAPFQALFRVLDCREQGVFDDEFTWSTTDTMVIEVEPEGVISAVGLGEGTATLSGAVLGPLGTVKVTVLRAGAARDGR